MADTADIVIVTALEEEREAVLHRLPRRRRKNPTGDDIHVYYTANLPVTFPNRTSGVYRVAVLSLPGMGRVQAATATNDAIRRWQPRYVVLVGIAGGVGAAGVQLGDVLVADQVVDYELQKLTARRAEIRPTVQPADSRLLTAARNLKVKDWRDTIGIARPEKGTPKRHIGTILSGDKVMALDAALAKYRQMWPKLIGVEMEAGGAATAAFNAPAKPSFFMVRGVSDLANQKKGSATVEQWRAYACEVAAAYAIALLRSGPIPLRPEASGPASATRARRTPAPSTGTTPGRRKPPASTIPLPAQRRVFTQHDKDEFLSQSLSAIKRYVQRALTALKRDRNDIATKLETISGRKFVATIYLRGEVLNRCKVWIGDGVFQSGIAYAQGRNISIDQDNSSHDQLTVEATDEALFLRTYHSHMVGFIQLPGGRLTAAQAAEYVWRRFSEPLSSR